MRSRLHSLITADRAGLLAGWYDALPEGDPLRGEARADGSCGRFLDLLGAALAASDGAPNLTPLHEMLADLSRERSRQGLSASKTARLVFALKRPLFARLQDGAGDPASACAAIVEAGELLDGLGLYTTEVFQDGREAVIHKQQNEMLELSTPVVTLWDGVLALPIIGTLDSGRTQVIMETLLTRVVELSAQVVIIDITGVATVDTLVAQHLIKTVSAAQLMGVECFISGIRPHIAQTIVHLGVDLAGIQTLATLADAFKLALRRIERGGQAPKQLLERAAGQAPHLPG